MSDIVERLRRFGTIGLEAADEIERLRNGIRDYLDGNYKNPRRHREEGPRATCKHERYFWEDCGCCVDDYFSQFLGDKS